MHKTANNFFMLPVSAYIQVIITPIHNLEITKHTTQQSIHLGHRYVFFRTF